MMRATHGDDYAIACYVSPMKVGKQMQFFGTRENLAKALLYAINGGVDEKLKIQISPKFEPITSDYFDYEEVLKKYDQILERLSEVYVNLLNIIHYMHDKYAYKRSEMALHDNDVHRFFATGIADLSVACDSLSAIKYAKVKVIRVKNGIAYDYEIEGEFPMYGNDDDRVDLIAKKLVKTMMNKIKKHKIYRNAEPIISILTITSNVVYGSKTGSTPDGRYKNGAVASLSSVSKMPFKYATDGISNTFSVILNALGKDTDLIVQNLDISHEDLSITLEELKVLSNDQHGNKPCDMPNID